MSNKNRTKDLMFVCRKKEYNTGKKKRAGRNCVVSEKTATSSLVDSDIAQRRRRNLVEWNKRFVMEIYSHFILLLFL